MGELELTAILCLMLGGQTEVKHGFQIADGSYSVRVDCETATDVIEVGLDNHRSSRDSIQQAVLAGRLSGKTPVVALIDTDGKEDSYEWQIETATQAVGLEYRIFDADRLIVWRMTMPFRESLVSAMNQLAATN
jgi:hypothetical protein